MPTPSSGTYEYSVAALEAAQTALLGLIDAGAGAGYIAIRNSSDTLLAQVPLDDPGGTVSAVTGQLTLTIAGPDTSADASGTAAYAEICDSDDTVILSILCQAGTGAVSGYLVLNTLSIIAGGPVSIISATIG